MYRKATVTISALLLGASAFAATINTTLSVQNSAVTLGGTGISIAGTATLTTIGSGSVTGSIPLSALDPTKPTISAPITIKLAGSDSINITLNLPTNLFLSGATSGAISGTVTGGTGTYAGATGSFPNMPGSVSGSLPTFSVSFSGAGTITTGGGGTTPPPATGPTITAVQDAASNNPKESIAEGSMFVVKGTKISPAGIGQNGLVSFNFPLPTSSDSASGNVKITFTPSGGGSSTDAYLLQLYNDGTVNQIVAILPSSLPPGNYNVTVTNGGSASAAFPATVVQRKFRMFTPDFSGTGLVAAYNFVSATQADINRFTTFASGGYTFSPAKPGQVLVVVGTGLGPVTGGDNVASPGGDMIAAGVDVEAIVGGVTIKPAYAGRAPNFASEDQINIQLPSNVPTGCTVPLQISVNGVLSTPGTFVAIAPNADASACVQPGFTTAQLQNFDNGGSLTIGSFLLSQLSSSLPQVGTVKLDNISGEFVKYTGFQLAGAAVQAQAASPSGSCQVVHVTGSQSQIAAGGGNLTGLDAGAITLSGPSGSGITNVAVKQDATNAYFTSLGTEGISIPGQPVVTLNAGNYTLTGAGGTDVKAFNASLSLGTPLSITGGLPATIVRNSGFTLNWTGGNATDLVQIIGFAGTTSGPATSPIIDATEFICATTAGAKTFTVPASITSQLPAVAANSTSQTGFLEVVSSPIPTQGNGLFTAGLTAGGNIDAGYFLSLVGAGGSVAYQ